MTISEKELEDKISDILPKKLKELGMLYSSVELATKSEIKELLQTMNKRFEASDKHFERVDKRFDKIFERFDGIDYRIDKVYSRLDEMTIALGHDFEEFNSLWVQDFLRVQGYPKLTIKKKTFIDGEYIVHSDSKEVEVDVFNEKPLIICEITAITKNIEKVTKFLRTIKFLTSKFGEPHSLLFITYGFIPKIRDEALKLLEQAGVKVYSVRQKEVEQLDP